MIAGCVGIAAPCPPGLSPMTKAELFFGRNAGAIEAVSDAAWQAFLSDEITPRFPDGLTVVASNGQWRGPDGRIIAERGFVLSILMPASAVENRLLEEIRDEYSARFMQNAVLLVQTPVCAGF
jgi:hypothetical protein